MSPFLFSFLASSSIARTLLFFGFIFIYITFRGIEQVSSCYGPKKYPLIGSLISFYKNRCRLLSWYTELLANSPINTIVVERLGARRTIVTANPQNVEYILKTNFNNYPKGKPFTDILGDLLGCGIFNVDGEVWHARRKLAIHEFTTKSLREFIVKALNTEVHDRLIPILSSSNKKKKVFDMQDLLSRLTFDNICKISLGTDPCLLNEEMPSAELASAFDIAAEISARRGMAPVSAVWKLKRALGVGSEKHLKVAVELIHGIIMEIIKERKKKIHDKQMEMMKIDQNDLLSRLIQGGHSNEVIRDMVISFIMAGKDTTSSALTWFFWLLSCNPNVEQEIVKEVTMHGKGEQIGYQELKEMKFLEASLCESMRLYPPVVWDSKHAARDDKLPDGTPVRKGDRVTYFPYGMGRMERLWGKDWEEFRPWRWMAGDNRKEVVPVSPYKFSVFQAGPRVCLGKEMAFVQMKYVAATVLRRFKLRRVDDQPPVLVPLLTSHMAGGLNMMVEERVVEL